MTLKVMIVRHGEKPPVKHQAPFGTTADGEQDWESLINPGWLRAGGLALLLDPRQGWSLPAGLATPAKMYASKPSDSADADSDGDKEGSKSKRPLETITPLSARLGHPIDLSFGKGDEKQLVDAVLAQAGPVLISWQHECIPNIANKLVGANPPAGDIPQKWPGRVSISSGSSMRRSRPVSPGPSPRCRSSSCRAIRATRSLDCGQLTLYFCRASRILERNRGKRPSEGDLV